MRELTKAQITRLAECEKEVEQGGQWFVRTGLALLAIREEQLYIATHRTFEEYLDERWGMSKSRAYQFISAAEVADDVKPLASTIVDAKDDATPPTSTIVDAAPDLPSESVARVLAKAPKEQRREVLKEAADTAPKGRDGKPKVRAKDVERVIATRKAPEPQASPPPEPATDDANAAPFANDASRVDAVLDQIDEATRYLSRLLDANKAEKKCRAPFAHFVSYLGGVGNIASGVNHIRENLPGDADPAAPGYIPRRSVKQRADFAKGGR